MKSIFNLTGKVAIATGAGRGVGRTLAEELANAGAEVVLIAEQKTKVKKAAHEITASTGVKAPGLARDVTKSASITETVQRAKDHFGHIDILINNAGTSIRKNYFGS